MENLARIRKEKIKLKSTVACFWYDPFKLLARLFGLEHD